MRLAALAAVVAIASGCGDTKPPSPRQVVESYNAALADHQDAKACGLLTATARRRLIGLTPADVHGCPAAFRRLDTLDPSSMRRLRGLKFAPVTDVQVRGSDAQATVAGARVVLHREGGAWRIATLR